MQAPLVATLTDEPEDYLKAAAAWSIGQARQPPTSLIIDLMSLITCLCDFLIPSPQKLI